MFEHPPPAPEWAHAVRRDEHKEPPLPSPTYSHVSHDASPYNMPLSTVPSAGYPFAGTSTHARYTHQPQYNSSGEYDVFQTPTPARRTAYEFHPPPVIYEEHVHGHPHNQMAGPSGSGAPLMSAGRTYDSTIPQYYASVMPEKAWGPTPDGKAGSRRKGKGKATDAGGGTPTPAAKRGGKRAQLTPEEVERSTKRARREDHPPPLGTTITILPTPPPTDGGRYSAQSMTYTELASPEDGETTGEQSRKSGIRVMRSEAEGRKLAVGHGEEGELSPPEDKPARLTPVTSLALDKDGQATIGTGDILQTDLAWMENGGARSGPSTSRIPQSPAETVEKIERRLLAFSAPPKSDEPMVGARIAAMGRVAVKKSVAAEFLKFLDLEASTPLVEETRRDLLESEEDWVNAMAGSSMDAAREAVKPAWPDDQAPWSIGGGSRRDRRSREDREKAVLLRRYLEGSPDELSDDEVLEPRSHPRGKGKSVSRLVSFALPHADIRQRQAMDSSSADAKAALMTVIRHRHLPPVQAIDISCACGRGVFPEMRGLVMCCSCKSWHHCLCTGQLEGADNWWCPLCMADYQQQHQPGSMHSHPSTPQRQTLRGYNQSEERSSAFKGQVDHIALAPSPMFAPASAVAPTFAAAGASLRTPMGRVVASPSSRNHRSRILSYGTDNMWPYNEEAAPAPAPSTPQLDARFTTPRIDDVPFDVTSTPSRHIDFNFGGGPLFSLTPLGGRSRNVSAMMTDTPLAYRGRVTSGVNPEGLGGGMGMSGRHDFLRDLAGPSASASASASASTSAAASGLAELASPRTATRPTFLGGLSPSPFAHKRSVSGNKFSAMRNSTRSGLGLGMPSGVEERSDEEEEEDNDGGEDGMGMLGSVKDDGLSASAPAAAGSSRPRRPSTRRADTLKGPTEGERGDVNEDEEEGENVDDESQ